MQSLPSSVEYGGSGGGGLGGGGDGNGGGESLGGGGLQSARDGGGGGGGGGLGGGGEARLGASATASPPCCTRTYTAMMFSLASSAANAPVRVAFSSAEDTTLASAFPNPGTRCAAPAITTSCTDVDACASLRRRRSSFLIWMEVTSTPSTSFLVSLGRAMRAARATASLSSDTAFSGVSATTRASNMNVTARGFGGGGAGGGGDAGGGSLRDSTTPTAAAAAPNMARSIARQMNVRFERRFGGVSVIS